VDTPEWERRVDDVKEAMVSGGVHEAFALLRSVSSSSANSVGRALSALLSQHAWVPKACKLLKKVDTAEYLYRISRDGWKEIPPVSLRVATVAIQGFMTRLTGKRFTESLKAERKQAVLAFLEQLGKTKSWSKEQWFAHSCKLSLVEEVSQEGDGGSDKLIIDKSTALRAFQKGVKQSESREAIALYLERMSAIVDGVDSEDDVDVEREVKGVKRRYSEVSGDEEVSESVLKDWSLSCPPGTVFLYVNVTGSVDSQTVRHVIQKHLGIKCHNIVSFKGEGHFGLVVDKEVWADLFKDDNQKFHAIRGPQDSLITVRGVDRLPTAKRPRIQASRRPASGACVESFPTRWNAGSTQVRGSGGGVASNSHGGIGKKQSFAPSKQPFAPTRSSVNVSRGDFHQSSGFGFRAYPRGPQKNRF